MQAPSFAKSPKAIQEIPAWIAFGDLRGHVEPCGCDPNTDLGGVTRLAKYHQNQKKLRDKLWLFDLGNNLHESGDMNRSKFAEKTIEFMRPDASLFNLLEMKQKDLDFVFSKKRRLVLWNQKNIQSNLVKNFIDIDEHFMAIGLIQPIGKSPEFKKYLRDFTLKELKKFKKNRGKQMIGLVHGDKNWVKTLEESKLFDLIIAANQRPLGLLPDHEEKVKPGMLHVGGSVYMVPFFAQGFLLSEKISTDKKPSLEEIFEQPRQNNQSKEFDFTQPEIVEWLHKGYEDAEILKNAMSVFRGGLQKEFQNFVTKKSSKKKKGKFLGAATCEGCHQKSHNIWKNSSHAHAHKTLKDVNQHENLECLKCHVVALEDENDGFMSEALTPQFKGVQCENCHGPMMGHIQNPKDKRYHKPTEALKEVCVSCHHTPHSTEFDFEKYWKKIKHP